MSVLKDLFNQYFLETEIYEIPYHVFKNVIILSVNDLSEENYIEISGEVNNPGIFPFSENITLSDLILLAGSFKENDSYTFR